MRAITMPFSWAIAGVVATAALAQGTSYTSVEATAGKPVQLTYHASAHKHSPPPAPPPTVRVTQAPKAGALIVRPAVLTTTKVAGLSRGQSPSPGGFLSGPRGLYWPRPRQLRRDKFKWRSGSL